MTGTTLMTMTMMSLWLALGQHQHKSQMSCRQKQIPRQQPTSNMEWGNGQLSSKGCEFVYLSCCCCCCLCVWQEPSLQLPSISISTQTEHICKRCQSEAHKQGQAEEEEPATAAAAKGCTNVNATRGDRSLNVVDTRQSWQPNVVATDLKQKAKQL